MKAGECRGFQTVLLTVNTSRSSQLIGDCKQFLWEAQRFVCCDTLTTGCFHTQLFTQGQIIPSTTSNFQYFFHIHRLVYKLSFFTVLTPNKAIDLLHKWASWLVFEKHWGKEAGSNAFLYFPELRSDCGRHSQPELTAHGSFGLKDLQICKNILLYMNIKRSFQLPTI